MAITFVASTRSPTSFPGAANNTSSCAIAKPTGTATDDLMICILSAGQVGTSAPAGWSLLNSLNNNPDQMVCDVYYKFAVAGEGTTYTFTDDSGGLTPLCGLIATYRGVDRNSPFNANATQFESLTNTKTDPGVTTTTYPCFILHYRMAKDTTAPTVEGTFSASGTLRQRTSNRGNSTAYFAELWDGNAQVNAGAQAGVSFSSTKTIDGSIERTIAIQAATRYGVETATGTDAAKVLSTTTAAADTGSGAEGAVPGPNASDAANAATDAGVLLDVDNDNGSVDDNASGVVKNGVTFKFGTDNAVLVDVGTPIMRVTDTITTSVETALVGIIGPLTGTGHRIVQISDDPGGITIVT